MHYLAWLIFIMLCISEISIQVKLVKAKRYYPDVRLEHYKLIMMVWLLDVVYLAYYYFGI